MKAMANKANQHGQSCAAFELWIRCANFFTIQTPLRPTWYLRRYAISIYFAAPLGSPMQTLKKSTKATMTIVGQIQSAGLFGSLNQQLKTATRHPDSTAPKAH